MPTNEPILTDEPELTPRQCGRCQQLFAGDPDHRAGTIPSWWVCPPCRTALFGE